MKRLNSGHLRVLKNLSVINPLIPGGNKKVLKGLPPGIKGLRGVRYWEVVYQRLSHLRLNILSAIQDISAICDVRYWEVSLYLFYTFNATYFFQSIAIIIAKYPCRICNSKTISCFYL